MSFLPSDKQALSKEDMDKVRSSVVVVCIGMLVMSVVISVASLGQAFFFYRSGLNLTMRIRQVLDDLNGRNSLNHFHIISYFID